MVFDLFDERLHLNLIISVRSGKNLRAKYQIRIGMLLSVRETVMIMFSKQLDPSSIAEGFQKIISNAKLKCAQDILDISRTPLTCSTRRQPFLLQANFCFHDIDLIN